MDLFLSDFSITPTAVGGGGGAVCGGGGRRFQKKVVPDGPAGRREGAFISCSELCLDGVEL
eukprot:COSAG02_NODE_495_length_21151_cov_31.954256_15_plen_61_part_00